MPKVSGSKKGYLAFGEALSSTWDVRNPIDKAPQKPIWTNDPDQNPHYIKATSSVGITSLF